eukprot:Gregarina_sp_Pseudo_9__949@NODE_1606_length_1459_cov_30_240141_g1490_i0_p1_GENE_NODE_1606_length_1459_cov_30_240141_g1490_i0NODE_1606_length_1459_cov_30_240141_g1490_i0_p1_ORF_typecomplete_len303_score98_55UNC50/PF05216_13/8_3e27_NODE_1606_length_1459_cov_30_240141_g1490_i03351243
MLPPHYKFPPRQPWHSFLRRLVKWRQIDWDSTFTQVLFALLYPSRLALVASHRLQTQGQLSRGDPGVFLCLLYLAGAAGLAHGAAFLAGRGLEFASFGGALVLGFLLWPLLLAAGLTLGLSFGLLFLLRRVSAFPRRSLAFSLASSMRPAVNVLFDDAKRAAQDSETPSPSIYSADAATVDWAYCFDLVCNGSLAGLFVLGVLHYLALPLVVWSPASLAAVTSNTLHVLASFMFVYNVAAGLAILRAPLWRAASMIFAPLALWVLLLIIFTLCRINVSTFCLEILFAPFLTSSAPSTQSATS